MANSPLTPQPTNEPLPLVARADLVIQESTPRGELRYVVKDPIRLKYFQLSETQHRLLTLLDGRRSFEEIHDELQAGPARVSPHQARQLIADLHRQGLIRSIRPGSAIDATNQPTTRRPNILLRALGHLFFIKLPGWEPSRFLAALAPWFQWMFSPAAVAACLVLVASSWLLIATHPDEFASGHDGFLGTRNLALLWLTVGALKLIHEIAHGLTARHFKTECHEIGVAFLMFSPCLYCDVSDAWLLRGKRSRILIAAAGIYIEIVLAALACWIWWFTHPGIVHQMAANVFVVTTASTILFNANPLLRYDGYYILSDLAEIPNLRRKSSAALWRSIGRLTCGLAPPTEETRSSRLPWWLPWFGLASLAYRWTIVFGLTWFLLHVLEPFGLTALAWGFLGISLLSAAAQSLIQLSRSQRSWEQGSMSAIRIVATVALLAALSRVAATQPLPINGWAPCMIEPRSARTLYAPVGGSLSEVHRSWGARVVAGDAIAVLEDDRALEMISLRVEREQSRLDVAIYRTLRDENARGIAEKALDSVNDRITRAVEERAALEIRAPTGGTLIPCRAGESRRTNGGLLTQRELGRFIKPRTPIGRVVEDDQWMAVLLLEQLEQEQLKVGAAVEIQLEGLPGTILQGQLVRLLKIDERRSTAPGEESGPDDAREGSQDHATTALYRANVLLDASATPLMDGMRGEARFSIPQPTLVEWIGDQLRRTFRARI